MNRNELIRKAGKFLIVGELDNPNSLRQCTLKGEDLDYFEGTKEGEIMLKAFCWPVEARAELIEILTQRQKLKRALDDSMSLVYQLNNKIARGEL